MRNGERHSTVNVEKYYPSVGQRRRRRKNEKKKMKTEYAPARDDRGTVQLINSRNCHNTSLANTFLRLRKKNKKKKKKKHVKVTPASAVFLCCISEQLLLIRTLGMKIKEANNFRHNPFTCLIHELAHRAL